MIARHFAANFVNFLIIIFVIIAGLIYWAKNQYQNEGPLRSDINFEVKKGDKLEIKDIQFIGLERFTEKDLLKVIKPIKEDAWWKFLSKKLYKQEDFDEGVTNLVTHFQEEGHVDARIVSDSLWVDNIDKGEQGLRLDFTIYEGPQYKVRDISWDGNTVYTDAQLTQSLGFEKGDVFNQTRYDENLNFRILTIPIEDTIYAFSLILTNLSLTEFFYKKLN